MTKTDTHRDAVAAYYDSADADGFYALIWGGEDIHIVLYDDGTDDDVTRAGARIVDHMAATLGDALSGNAHIVDLGSGYGGSARRLARITGCAATCINLSVVQNKRARALNAAAGLDKRITVIDGDFAAVPAADGAFDIVWSQDALLHAPEADAVLREAFRILKPNGRLIFTDPMQHAAGVDPALDDVYARLNLPMLRTPEAYGAMARAAGFVDHGFDDLTVHLRRHYAAIDRKLAAEAAQLVDVTPAFIAQMRAGLQAWVQAADAGRLRWGVLSARKAD